MRARSKFRSGQCLYYKDRTDRPRPASHHTRSPDLGQRNARARSTLNLLRSLIARLTAPLRKQDTLSAGTELLDARHEAQHGLLALGLRRLVRIELLAHAQKQSVHSSELPNHTAM